MSPLADECFLDIRLLPCMEHNKCVSKTPVTYPSEKRRVRFLEKVHVYFGGHYMTDEEKALVWYTGEEYKAIKVEMVSNLKRIKESKEEDESDYCYRGLEQRTKIGSRARKRNKEGVFYAVLQEQALMHPALNNGSFHGDHDLVRLANSIAMASIQASLPALVEARSRGQNDEKCASSVYTEWARVVLNNRTDSFAQSALC